MEQNKKIKVGDSFTLPTDNRTQWNITAIFKNNIIAENQNGKIIIINEKILKEGM